MYGATEYREWIENNRPDPPPAKLPAFLTPDDVERLEKIENEWKNFQDELYPPEDHESQLFNRFGFDEVKKARVYIQNLKRAINRHKTQQRELTKNVVKTSVIIPRSTEEMLFIFPQRIIQAIIKNINTSNALAKSPPKSPQATSTPFYPPSSYMDSSDKTAPTEEQDSVKNKSLKNKSYKKNSSISLNQKKEKLIEIIMQQPNYNDHIEKTLQELSLPDANKTIDFFRGLGFGEYFSGKMNLIQKKKTIIIVFKKLRDVNPRKMPLRATMKIEQFLGTRVFGKKHKTRKTKKN